MRKGRFPHLGGSRKHLLIWELQFLGLAKVRKLTDIRVFRNNLGLLDVYLFWAEYYVDV